MHLSGEVWESWEWQYYLGSDKLYIKHARWRSQEEFPIKWENGQFVIALSSVSLYNKIHYRSVVVEYALKALTDKFKHHLTEITLND